MNPRLLLLYLLPLLAVLWIYIRRRRRRDREGASRWNEAKKSGLTEPPSLHSEVNRAICVGSGGCVRACPEGALGIVRGKAHLVNPSACIGHGACVAACPAEAIKLVWGTAKRGMDIPFVKPTFETNVPGIYIAGELGGMGLIRKAVEQGRQAIESIVKARSKRGARAGAGRGAGDGATDVLIVGAGPAGIAASLGAMEHGLSFVTIEQEPNLGGTVYHYPRNKVVMTEPVKLPLAGKVELRRASKEDLLATWQGIIDRHGVPIRFGEKLEAIETGGCGYAVKTSAGIVEARAVVLAIGRRGSPRALGVDGEDLPKVVYRLVDAEQYEGKRVVVVGGGDAAIEAAVQIADVPHSVVTLAHRGPVFNRIKIANREKLDAARAAGRVEVLLDTTVSRITQDEIWLQSRGEGLRRPNDAVIICAGGVMPTTILKQLGVKIETKYGTT